MAKGRRKSSYKAKNSNGSNPKFEVVLCTAKDLVDDVKKVFVTLKSTNLKGKLIINREATREVGCYRG